MLDLSDRVGQVRCDHPIIPQRVWRQPGPSPLLPFVVLAELDEPLSEREDHEDRESEQ